MKHWKCLTNLKKKVKCCKVSIGQKSIFISYVGKTVSLETRNNLLELLSYVGLGNETANDLSQFNEQQCLINKKESLEFGCRGDTQNHSGV